jgi:methionyl-tRNA formyltransferase
MVKQVRVPLESSETATILYEKILAAHRRIISATWELLFSGIPPLRSQNEDLATYWPGRSPADGRIEPTMTVREVDRLVRAVTHPYPGAFVVGSNGDRLTIWAGSPDAPTSSEEPQIRLALSDGDYWIHAWSSAPVN